jgi:CTP synthase
MARSSSPTTAPRPTWTSGHYERFTGVAARRTDSVSSGRIYSNVLEKERRGDYLGKTIQVIPHVTDEIKDFIAIGEDEVDFMLCEIGGTVGDIEGLPFFEAIRQFSQDKPRGQCIFMHLTLLPYHRRLGRAEDQADAAQRQGAALDRDRARHPGLPVRAADPGQGTRQAGAVLQRAPGAVIAAMDLKSIYEAPLAYHREGLDQAVLDAFRSAPRRGRGWTAGRTSPTASRTPKARCASPSSASTPSLRTPINPSPRR